jgi:hypothetical protein
MSAQRACFPAPKEENMEALFVGLWVVLMTDTETKKSYIGNNAYVTYEECSKANSHDLKGYSFYCFKVNLPASKFHEIKDALK